MNHDKTFKMLQERFNMIENGEEAEVDRSPQFGSEEDIFNLLQGVSDKHFGINLENVNQDSIIKALREAYNLGMGDIRVNS